MSEKGIVQIFGLESTGILGDPKVVAATTYTPTQVKIFFDQEVQHASGANPNDSLNLANYVFTMISGGGVSIAPQTIVIDNEDPTVVLITLNREMTAGATYRVTVSSVETEGGAPLTPGYTTYDFLGFGVRPTVTSAVPTDGVVVLVNFSESMDTGDGNLADKDNYVFSTLTGPATSALSVVIVTDSQVEVTLTTPTGIGHWYTVTVSNVKDLSGNLIQGPPSNQASFLGVAENTKLTSVTNITINKVRFGFSKQMNRSDLETLAYFSITPIESGAAAVYLNSIELPPDAYPTYADLIISEATNGKDYRGQVSTSMRDRWGNTVGETFKYIDYHGLGEAPTIDRVQSLSENSVRVFFTEPMLDNIDIRTPGKYTFTGALSVLSISSVSGNQVDLVTSDQSPGVLYTLTVVA